MKCAWAFIITINFLLQADGFTSETLVHTYKGLMPIDQCQIGDSVFNNQDVYAYPISHIFSYYSSCYVKITIDDEFICVAPYQKLYSVGQDDWVCAIDLKISHQLLCKNNKIISIDNLEIIQQPQKMYAISIETNHTFCVGNHGIIAHNIEPATTMIAVITASAVCPPAAAVVVVGEVIALGITGLLMYCMHKKLQKNKQKLQGCFSEKSEYQTQGCQVPQKSIETIVCGIPIIEEKINEVIPYVKAEEINANCEFPIEVVSEANIQLHNTKKDNCEEKEQYNGPWYNRTEDWINEHQFGQKIKKSLERTHHMNQGKRVFKVVKNIENYDGLKKGDFVVVDAMHKDHLEVFDKSKEWSHVVNFDGTVNIEKTKQGTKERRIPLGK